MVNFIKKYRFYFIGIFLFLFILIFVFLFSRKFVFSGDFSDVSVDVNGEYVYPSVSACYGNLFRCKSVEVSASSDVDTSILGTYSVVFSASYGKHKDSVSQKVFVVDNESPVIDVSSDSLSVCPLASEFDVDVKAHDNYDGDLTSAISRAVLDDSLVFSVSDSSGNVGSQSVSLVREDVLAPSISLSGGSTVYVALNSKYSEPGYSASDNCDGDLTGRVVVTGSVDTSKSGSYTIKYSVSDDAGNGSSVSRIVSVYAPNSSGGRVIYLTFDDGPSQYTGELLGILAKYNVKATFFVTNVNSKYSYFIKEAYNQGHSIALHTSSHNYSRIYSSVDAYFNDLDLINQTVFNMTGSYSKLLRFPGGSSNTVSRKYSRGIMSTLSGMVTDRGYKYFDWNVSSGDADGRSHDSSFYANSIINGLGNGSYYIVLQHDTNINSIRAVGRVIEYGLSHGYSFQSLNIGSPTVHHKIAN